MALLDNINAVTNLAENNEVQLMVFKTSPLDDLDAPYYAINVFKTREAIESKKHHLTLIPGVHPLLEGTISLRGVLVPIIDLPQWLGSHLTKAQRKESKILICDFNGIMIGLRICFAHRIVKKSWEDLHAPDGYSISQDSKVVNDTRLDDGSICLVLDYEKLLAEVIPEAVVNANVETADIELDALPPILKKGITLIAEDSKTAQRHLQKMFDNLNLKIKIFNNGKLLLDYIDNMPDPSIIPVVITDLEMPEVSGFKVVKILKSNESTKNIPVIVNSSMSGESNKRDAAKLGADGFIDKTKSHGILPLILDLLKKRQG